MKICITGGAGFIGFHLAQKLFNEGHEVYGFDNFNNYYDPSLKKARQEKLAEMSIPIVDLDLNSNSLVEYMSHHKFDIVMHLAAYAGVRHSLVEPEKYLTNNIMGTHNLIEACKKAKIEKIVYASTSCVMAGNSLPWNENEKLGYQLNPYGYTKATNESQFMASDFASAIGLRFFTVYGPWGRPDMALFNFTNKIVNGEPITLFNHGDMIRDFTYVGDIVQGIGIILDHAMKNNVKDIYNIGYGKQVQLMDFVDHIETNLGRKAIRNYVPKHPADTHETWSNTEKLQALGYKPTTPIETGITAFIDWYKSYYGVN
jgi:UDP-glucuronate 4-epimerase